MTQEHLHWTRAETYAEQKGLKSSVDSLKAGMDRRLVIIGHHEADPGEMGLHFIHPILRKSR